MKVLLLPNNTASEVSHKVRALKSIGVEARGLSLSEHKILSAVDIKTFSDFNTLSFTGWKNRISFYNYLYDSLKWADIVHWFWDFGVLPFKLDKNILKVFNKPGVIQWLGSEIRNPELDFEINPYYKRAFLQEGYEHRWESEKNSKRIQKEFSKAGFYPVTYIGMAHYIDSEIFSKWFYVPQTSITSDYQPAYPALNKSNPLILHAPSAPNAKGTKYVLRAIDNLREKYSLEFKLIEGLPRAEVMNLMRQCDIYIDQIIIGMFGLASIEAMSFGKPVVCYINDVMGRDYPDDLPIVNANPDNLTEQLEILIKDSALRHELGKKSREYIEKYHSEKVTAQKLVKIYDEVINLHGKKREKV